MSKNVKNVFILLSLAILPITISFLKLPIGIIFFVLIGFGLFWKFPKIGFLTLPILFLLVLSLNKLFNVDLQNRSYSFDQEKIIITSPKNLALIEKYKYDDVYMPYKLRNLFYSPWLVSLSWINLILKLLSPTYLILVLDYSGFFILILGIIEFVKSNKKKWQPFFWGATVVLASGLGLLVDSGAAWVLAFPTIVYFFYLAISNKKFSVYFKYWLILFLVDCFLK